MLFDTGTLASPGYLLICGDFSEKTFRSVVPEICMSNSLFHMQHHGLTFDGKVELTVSDLFIIFFVPVFEIKVSYR